MTMDWIRGEHGGESEREGGGERQEAPSAEPARVVTRPVSVAASPARSPGPGMGRGPDWVPVGPSTVLFGQITGGPGRASGRVNSLAVSPDGDRIYAGTANGGVWYSGDGGAHWIPLDSFESRTTIAPDQIAACSLSIGALFVLFGATSAQDQVFAATGEGSGSALAWGTTQHTGRGIRGAGDGAATGPAPAVATNPAVNPWTYDASTGADAFVGRAIHRIAAELTTAATPAVAKMFVATNAGLYVRDFTAATQQWQQLRDSWVWDVVWDGARLWIAMPTKLYVSADEGQTFSEVTLPDSFGRTVPPPPAPPGSPPPPPPPTRPSFNRLVLAALPSGSGVYVLGGGGRLWRATGGASAAVPVLGLPYDMFGAPVTHDSYAIALTAWADTAGDVVLAGATTKLLRGTIATATPTVVAPTEVQNGTHADYHAFFTRTVGTARRVYVGSDGGVFRSDSGAALGTFQTRNNGLAVLEPYFLAGSPLSEAMLLIGTQDNGANRCMTPETWMTVIDGDAGGVAIDPADSRRIAAQYINGKWRVADTSYVTWFPAPRAAITSLSANDQAAVIKLFDDATTSEQNATPFYSGCSAIVDPTTGKTLLAIGARRVWLTDDWGVSWKTLPTLTDPAASPAGTAPRALAPRADQDVIGDVTVVRFAGPERILVLTEDAAFHFQHHPASGTTAERWVKTKLPSPFGSKTSVLRTDIALDRAEVGSLGSAYMTLARPGESGRQHHVYWFDGTGRWLDCGLDIDTPANAVVVDPLDHSVYVGTDVGVFRGTTLPTAATTWTWEHFSDGLPEAPVSDLIIDERGTSVDPPLADRVRLLRASLAGRGVFEIPVSHTRREPAIVTYVRAHDEDRRRSAIPSTPRRPYPRTASSAARTGPLAVTDYDPLPLDASPDIRVRRAPGSAYPRLTSDGSRYNGPADPRTYVQLAIDAARGTSTSMITDVEWQRLSTGPNGSSRKTNQLPFDADPTGENPDCTDVVEFVLDEPDDPGGFCSCRAPNQPVRIDVVVHTRHYKEIAASAVKVTLLRAEYTNASGTPTAADLPVTWNAEILADRTRSGAAVGAWLTGTPWSYVDASMPLRPLGTPIDARRAGVATFHATLPAGNWLLMAIVLADDDAFSVPTSNAPFELARASRHVALRSVHAAVEPIHHTFQEWHSAQTPNAAYRGGSDDQRVVERPAIGASHLLPKLSLHVCTQESAVATFNIELPSGGHFLAWELLQLGAVGASTVIRTHPQYTPAALVASSPAASVTSGQYAWRWDGRDSSGLLVPAGTYASRLRIKNATTGAIATFSTTIEAEGTADEVTIRCQPKDDADLVAAVTAASQGPIDSHGQRITSDCVVLVRRTHAVFIGHGSMEPTRADVGPHFGAVAIPHSSGLGYKGWIDRASPSSAYRVSFESETRTDGAITLERGSGPAPLNPWVTPSAARIEGARITEVTSDYATDALLEAGVVVRSKSGTCPSPAATYGGILARSAAFGTFGTAAGEDLATRTPPFNNKQTKRTRPIDALDVDEHSHPQDQPASSDCAPSPDEPLHMQATFQAAVFGGRLASELPMASTAAATLARRVGVAVSLPPYDEGSAYHAYHHAVVLGHTYTAAANELAAYVPRKVIRGWNGQGRTNDGMSLDMVIGGGRNVLVVAHLTVVWYVEHVPAGGPSVVLASLIGTGPGTFAALPNVGRIARSFTMPGSRPPGQVRSVFKYRLQLAPFGPDHAWESEALSPETTGGPPRPLPDPFSSHAATLDPETTDGDVLVGQSVMLLP